jgi:cytochrome c oxidase subunit IV
VRVNNQPAGSFTVDYFTNNDILIYGLIGLFAVATAGVLFLVARKRTG